MNRVTWSCRAAGLALALSSLQFASAAPLVVTGNGSLGDYSATLSYSAIDAFSGTLTVALSNLATTAPGGKITAFVFNAPTGPISVTGVTQGTFATNFSLLNGIQNGINGQPYGNFDIGAALTGGDFQGGGGNPAQGITIGNSGTFVFNLTGSGLNVTDTAFLTALIGTNSDPQGNSGVASFVVRFRGFDNGGSEKVPGGPAGGPPPPPPQVEEVPEPASFLVWSMLAVGGAALRLRQSRARRS